MGGFWWHFYRGKRKWGIFRKQEWATENFLNRLYRFKGAFRIAGRSTCCPVGSLLLLIISKLYHVLNSFQLFFSFHLKPLPFWATSGPPQLHTLVWRSKMKPWAIRALDWRRLWLIWLGHASANSGLTTRSLPWGAARYAGHVGGHRIALQNNRGGVQSTG